MRVVYSPAHLAHDTVTETVMGAVIPANEVAGAGRADPDDARGGRRLHARGADRARRRADPRRPRSGPRAVRRGGLAARRAPSRSAARPHRRHVPDVPDVRGHEPGVPGLAARDRGMPPDGPAGGVSTRANPLVAGTCRCRAGRRGRRPDDRRISCSAGSVRPTGCAGRPAITPRARCPAATASSTTPRSRPRRSSGATGERVAILDVDYHHGNGTQQIFWRRGDVLYVSLHADPERQYPFFLGRADETGEGQGSGANLNLPLPAGTDDEPTSPRSTAASRRSPTRRATSSSCRSASTPTATTRSATSR